MIFLICIFSPFNSPAGYLYYLASNDWMIITNELERMQKEPIPCTNFPGRTEENYEQPQSGN